MGYLLFLQEQIKGIIIIAHRGEQQGVRDARQNLTHFHDSCLSFPSASVPPPPQKFRVALEHPGLTSNTDLVNLIAVGAEVVPYDALPVRGRALRQPLR